MHTPPLGAKVCPSGDGAPQKVQLEPVTSEKQDG